MPTTNQKSIKPVIHYRGAAYRLAVNLEEKQYTISFSYNEVGFLIQLEQRKLEPILKKAVYKSTISHTDLDIVLKTLSTVISVAKATPGYISRTELLMADKLKHGLYLLWNGNIDSYPPDIMEEITPKRKK